MEDSIVLTHENAHQIAVFAPQAPRELQERHFLIAGSSQDVSDL
jgi:hypothetical protein